MTPLEILATLIRVCRKAPTELERLFGYTVESDEITNALFHAANCILQVYPQAEPIMLVNERRHKT